MEDELRLGFADLPKTAPAEIASEEEEDFEFAFSIESDPGAPPDTTADDIFYNGRILPVYPLFNRDLIGRSADPKEKEEEEEESSVVVSKTKAPKSAPQSPDQWRKSSSTGSSASRKWKLRDLVVGRSRSDGKERFLVIPLSDEKQKKNSSAKTVSAEAEKIKEKIKEKSGKGKGEISAKEMDIVTAHRIYYGKVGSGGGQPATPGSSRRSFLPYRQELLGGLFGTAKHHLF